MTAAASDPLATNETAPCHKGPERAVRTATQEIQQHRVLRDNRRKGATPSGFQSDIAACGCQRGPAWRKTLSIGASNLSRVPDVSDQHVCELGVLVLGAPAFDEPYHLIRIDRCRSAKPDQRQGASDVCISDLVGIHPPVAPGDHCEGGGKTRKSVATAGMIRSGDSAILEAPQAAKTAKVAPANASSGRMPLRSLLRSVPGRAVFTGAFLRGPDTFVSCRSLHPSRN